MKERSFEVPDRDERGVSPVIGVILMVAITVILAAVIASFVLGFGGSVSSNASAGVETTQNEVGNYSVTVISLGDNTKGVYCTQTNVTTAGNSSTNTAGIGDTINYCSGSVVAIGEGNAGNATIRTLG